jgi:hypothetical protein
MLTKLAMTMLEGDFGGQSTTFIGIYALRHILNKILFDVFVNQWKPVHSKNGFMSATPLIQKFDFCIQI